MVLGGLGLGNVAGVLPYLVFWELRFRRMLGNDRRALPKI